MFRYIYSVPRHDIWPALRKLPILIVCVWKLNGWVSGKILHDLQVLFLTCRRPHRSHRSKAIVASYILLFQMLRWECKPIRSETQSPHCCCRCRQRAVISSVVKITNPHTKGGRIKYNQQRSTYSELLNRWKYSKSSCDGSVALAF